MKKNHPGKEKASRKILEALTAIWHKHLASRRPPADKRRKFGKAESARNESLPGLQESLHRPPDGRDFCHRGAHGVKSPIRHCLSTILSYCQSSCVVIHISKDFRRHSGQIATQPRFCAPRDRLGRERGASGGDRLVRNSPEPGPPILDRQVRSLGSSSRVHGAPDAARLIQGG